MIMQSQSNQILSNCYEFFITSIQSNHFQNYHILNLNPKIIFYFYYLLFSYRILEYIGRKILSKKINLLFSIFSNLNLNKSILVNTDNNQSFNKSTYYLIQYFISHKMQKIDSAINEIELTAEEIDEIVDRQLRKLQNQYNEVHKYDILIQKVDDQPEKIIQQAQNKLNEEEQDINDQEIPYQTIGEGEYGDINDEVQIAERQSSQSQSEQQAKIESENTQTFANQASTKPIDQEKIKSIASSFTINVPDWVNDPRECQKRLRDLFKKY